MTMTATVSTGVADAKPQRTKGRRAFALAAPLAVAAAVAFGAFGVHKMVTNTNNHPSVTRPASTAPGMPRSPEIEQAWGVRFTNVRLLAGTGLIDVRYQVIDPAKAAKLHADGVKNIPRLRVPGGRTVTPDSTMFHFHTIADTSTAGRGFDILYGNAREALRGGGEVTILLSNGMKLDHVPVTN